MSGCWCNNSYDCGLHTLYKVVLGYSNSEKFTSVVKYRWDGHINERVDDGWTKQTIEWITHAPSEKTNTLDGRISWWRKSINNTCWSVDRDVRLANVIICKIGHHHWREMQKKWMEDRLRSGLLVKRRHQSIQVNSWLHAIWKGNEYTHATWKRILQTVNSRMWAKAASQILFSSCYCEWTQSEIGSFSEGTIIG